MIQKPIKQRYIDEYTKRRYKELKTDEQWLKKILKENNIKLKDKNTLDLAAGPGTLTKILSKYKPKQQTYLDKNEGYIIKAKQKLKKITNITYEQKDLMEITKLKAEEYDFIICNISIYYAQNEWMFFKEIKRILKPNGIFLFTITTKKYLEDKPKSIERKAIIYNNINELLNTKIIPVCKINEKKLEKKWKRAELTEIYNKKITNKIKAIMVQKQ